MSDDFSIDEEMERFSEQHINNVSEVMDAENRRDEVISKLPDQYHSKILKVASDFNLQSDDPAWVMFQSLLEQQQLINAGKTLIKTATDDAVMVAKKQGKVSLDQHAKAAADAAAAAIEKGIKAAFARPVDNSIKKIVAAASNLEDEALNTSGKIQAEANKQLKKMAAETENATLFEQAFQFMMFVVAGSIGGVVAHYLTKLL